MILLTVYDLQPKTNGMILNKTLRRVLKWLFVTIIVVSAVELVQIISTTGRLEWTYVITLVLGIGGLLNILRQERKAGNK